MQNIYYLTVLVKNHRRYRNDGIHVYLQHNSAHVDISQC
jgi:hypothetical protein